MTGYVDVDSDDDSIMDEEDELLEAIGKVSESAVQDIRAEALRLIREAVEAENMVR